MQHLQLVCHHILQNQGILSTVAEIDSSSSLYTIQATLLKACEQVVQHLCVAMGVSSRDDNIVEIDVDLFCV